MMDHTPLDTDAVALWMTDHIKGFQGPVSAIKFTLGQSNPTYALTAPSGRYVLRRKPPGILLKSAHAVEREFRVQNALSGSAVPVAKMYRLCEDPSIIGSAFYVMDMIDGVTYNEPHLPHLARDKRRPIILEMNRVLGAIHNVDLSATGLTDFGPEGNYYRRQTDRWTKQYRASETETLPDMDALAAWLDQNMPADDGQRSLVHGDYRLDNMLFAKDAPSCLAVLDWELSTLGHPYADLAGVLMQWSMPVGEQGRGLAGLQRSAEGLMEDQEFIDLYCARRGLAQIDRFEFYLAFCYFRMAAILQGVKKRALEGNASNPEKAMQLAKHIPALASAGIQAAQGL